MDDVEVDGDLILINDYDDINSYGEIYIYEIDISVDEAEVQIIMDKDFFQSEDPFFNIISFEVLPTSAALTDKLLVSTTDMVLYAVNYRAALEAKKNGLQPNSAMWDLDIRQELDEQELYYNDLTLLEKTFTIFFYPDTDPYSLISNYFTLIHTSNTAIYVCALKFNESNLAPDSDKIVLNFIAVYSSYGTYQSQLTLRGNVNADAFAEVYKNPATDEYLVAVYSFELHELMRRSQNIASGANTKLITEPLNGAVVY